MAAALTLFASAAFSADVMRVEGAPVTSTKAEEAVFWRSAADSKTTTAIMFRSLPASALKSLQEENSPDVENGRLRAKALKIGVNRNAATEIDADTPPALNWKSNGGGYVAHWAITSPDAHGLRAALQIRALPDSAELRFSGSAAPERVIGVVSGQEANALRDDNQIYWTPITEGETQNIEIFLPSPIKPEEVKVRLNAVSHLFTSAQDGFSAAPVVKASQYCEIDVACKSSLGSSFQNTAKAVARTVTTDNAYSYGCTGTLLNDTNNSQTPYFWSANHCLISEVGASAQSLANTLNTFWFDEAASCGGSAKNPSYTSRTGGAKILHSQASTDTSLLQLNDAAPTGSYLAGWDANSRFSSGAMIGIHHPNRDIKKVSVGKGEGKTCDTMFSSAEGGVTRSNLTLVSWSEGTTEGGSSGSGLFTLSNGNYYLRGGLQGGAADCSNSGRAVNVITNNSANADCYSSIYLVYDSIKQWLAPTAAPVTQYGPTRVYTGQWANANESGWGLTVIMGFPNDAKYIFVPWYTYDSNG
ncbi:MAG: hypothetical protein LBB65_03290, partial [Burkholderiales bacterium]|nr:hypothetical protein [Burkholderiales bacterium]